MTQCGARVLPRGGDSLHDPSVSLSNPFQKEINCKREMRHGSIELHRFASPEPLCSMWQADFDAGMD
jgi:hypothetical protein